MGLWNVTTEISRDNMEVCTDLILRELYIDPMEKFKYAVHTSTAVDSTLHQIICSTAKEYFEKSEGKINLFGLESITDKQISFWVNQTEETHRKHAMPMTVEGFIKLNDNKKQFNFLKSLDIANINAEVENLHPVRMSFGKKKTSKES